MSKTYFLYSALAMLLLVLAGCAAQQGTLDPEQIDPYSYEIQPAADYSAQAYSAYSQGELERAARYYLAHLQNKQDDYVSWYNLACCYGLLNRPELAAKYLQQAYKTGYRDLGHIKQDTDFSLVKDSAVFTAALDSLQSWSDRRSYYQGEEKFLSARQLIPYRLHLPQKFDPQKKYPLLIGLHGYGDKAMNFSALWRYLEGEEVIFAVPEAPYPFTEGEIGFSWGPSVPMESPVAEEAYQLVMQYINGLQDELAHTYNIGPTWLLGFSQGAYTSYILGLKNPGRYAGLVACGGALLPELLTDMDYKASGDLKVIISHGKQDRVIGYEEALAAERILEEKGLQQIRFDSFEGGHSVSPNALRMWLDWIQE